MIKRKVEQNIIAALKDTPVILLHGARQTGKSTLLKYLIESKISAQYINLDEPGFLSAAQNNPTGFLDAYEGSIAIDEVQRAPGLFQAIKQNVDSERKPGKFLLSGSSNILFLSKLSESLAGRIEILNLYPFSQSEIEGSKKNFVEEIFSSKKFSEKNTTNDLYKRVLTGGYPEVTERKSLDRKNAWFKSYVTTILQKDIRDLANIERLTELPKILKIFAARIGGLLNFAELSRDAAIPQSTLKRYISLLEAAFLIQPVPAWSGNYSSRLIKSPKVYLTDTGLVSYLLGFTKDKINIDDHLWGKIFENFVLMELIKQISWSKLDLSLHHFRTSGGKEIDFIIERNDGTLITIEIKAGSNINNRVFENLRNFEKENKKKFLKGIVIYTGKEVIPYAKNMFAVPVKYLW